MRCGTAENQFKPSCSPPPFGKHSDSPSMPTPASEWNAFLKGDDQRSLSKMFSAVLRHEDAVFHKDGSLSIPEFMTHRPFANNMNRLRSRVAVRDRIGRCPREEDMPAFFDPKKCKYTDILMFIALANTIIYNDKKRFEIGYIVSPERTGQLPTEHRMVPDFRDEAETQRLLSRLPRREVMFVLIRVVSGYSGAVQRKMHTYEAAPPENKAREAFAVHGTIHRAYLSIKKSGLIPGGLRQGRNETHFLNEKDLRSILLRDSSERYAHSCAPGRSGRAWCSDIRQRIYSCETNDQAAQFHWCLGHALPAIV